MGVGDSPLPLALVTAGMSRIGAAIATRLAEAGYALALHGRQVLTPEPTLQATLEQTAVPWGAFEADFTNSAEVTGLIPQVIEHFERPPCLLVNNAAAFAEGGWADVSADSLAEMMKINFHAPLLLAQALVAAHSQADDGKQAPALPCAPSCTIINILDQRIANPVSDQLAYSLSKQALWQATQTLAVAFGVRARVNAVAPGLTLATADYSAGQLERLAQRMPLRSLPVPSDIAEAVLYLARAQAVTGQTIFVDSGANLAAFPRDFVHLDK